MSRVENRYLILNLGPDLILTSFPGPTLNRNPTWFLRPCLSPSQCRFSVSSSASCRDLGGEGVSGPRLEEKRSAIMYL